MRVRFRVRIRVRIRVRVRLNVYSELIKQRNVITVECLRVRVKGFRV